MKTLKYILIFNLLIYGFGAFGQRYERLVNLRGVWKFNIGDNPRWAAENLDDASWREIYVPSTWEEEGFNGYDGYAWYRVKFKLNANESLENLYLELGYIDDVDEVYINGKLIGFSGKFPPDFSTAYNAKRRYSIPTEYINPNGEVNTIAVRVYDTVLEGGILKGSIGVYKRLSTIKNVQVLEGIWKFREGNSRSFIDPAYNDENWDDVIVPSYWRSYKHWRPRTSIAWYRKTFELAPSLKEEPELVAVLGKIDDFDKVYLNGNLIGFTNDGQEFGSSDSYRQHRVYVIPDEFLNKTGKNTISVQVKDIGGEAGMYEGPIGILPIDDYRRFIDGR